MKKSVELICIENNKILLIRNYGLWKIPGGRQYKNESDEEAIYRLIEEQTGSKPVLGELYKKFIFKKHRKSEEITTYFGNLEYRSAFDNVEWIPLPAFINQRDIEILKSLGDEGYLTYGRK